MESAIANEKRMLRKEMFEERRLLDPTYKKNYDRRICNHLEKLIDEKGYGLVHTYIPIAGEINILPLIRKLLQKGVEVVCPKTLANRRLENRMLYSLDHLEGGPMGTLHPANKNVFVGDYDLIIVPGLAVDFNKYRLGYGGGYYDAFLSTQESAHTIGLFYPFQELIVVPVEPHDVQLKEVLFFE